MTPVQPNEAERLQRLAFLRDEICECDQVLVRVVGAGLCHSDLSVINGSRPRPLPMVLGHEGAGEIVELGPGIRDLAAGDHVALMGIGSGLNCAMMSVTW